MIGLCRPADAVSVLDDWLADVVLEMGVPVLAIAGNHDSASRLSVWLGDAAESRLPTWLLCHPAESAMSAWRMPLVQSMSFFFPYADPPYVRDYFLARAGDDETAREAGSRDS